MAPGPFGDGSPAPGGLGVGVTVGGGREGGPGPGQTRTTDLTGLVVDVPLGRGVEECELPAEIVTALDDVSKVEEPGTEVS